MVELSQLDKAQLIELVKMFASTAMTVDGLWFTEIEDRFGIDAAVEIDTVVWKKFAPVEARRIKNKMQIEGDCLDALGNALDYSILTMPEGFKTKTERLGNSFTLTYTDCRAQEARMRSGRGEFPCKTVGIELLTEFAKVFGADIETTCLVCPPDEHPDDVWCSWKFTTK